MGSRITVYVLFVIRIYDSWCSFVFVRLWSKYALWIDVWHSLWIDVYTSKTVHVLWLGVDSFAMAIFEQRQHAWVNLKYSISLPQQILTFCWIKKIFTMVFLTKKANSISILLILTSQWKIYQISELDNVTIINLAVWQTRKNTNTSNKINESSIWKHYEVI